MDFRYLILYPALSVFVASVVIPFLPVRHRSTAGFSAVFLNAIFTSLLAVPALYGDPVEITLHAGFVFGDIRFQMDALAAWFILIINLTCITGGWYGIHYMKAYLSESGNLSLHWIAFLFFHLSMIGVVSVQHGLAFLVAWEIMSVASFLLMMFEYAHFATLKAGINYLIQAHIGVALLTIAFISVWVAEGSFDFASVAVMMARPGVIWLFLLFFIGFAIKAGFIPLHTWLPHAHPAAPAHISGIMSGVMVTMGIYGVLRMITWLRNDILVIGIAVFILSGLTAFYGILSASIHRDYKRLLAFSTIENMGIVGMGIGVGLIGKYAGDQSLLFLGFGSALLHSLNHSLYKPLLFFSSGNLYQLTHTRNMEQLGGLVRKLPFTAFFFLCGSVAIAGLPPFNGFVSKFLLFSGMIESISIKSFELNILMITGVMGLAVVGGLSLLAFTKAFSVIFLGVPRVKPQPQPQENFSMGHMPLFLILFLMLLIGLSPSLMLSALAHTTILFDASSAGAPVATDVFDTLSGVGIASFTFIVVAVVVYFIRSQFVSGRVTTTTPTWSCGYQARNTRMQYTGKSFSKSLAKLLAFITGEEKRYPEIHPETVFPSNRSYQSSYAEFFEKLFINKISNRLLGLMSFFRFIHNGRVQYYILYGFLFMLLVIVATFLNIV